MSSSQVELGYGVFTAPSRVTENVLVGPVAISLMNGPDQFGSGTLKSAMVVLSRAFSVVPAFIWLKAIVDLTSTTLSSLSGCLSSPVILLQGAVSAGGPCCLLWDVVPLSSSLAPCSFSCEQKE